MSKTNGFRVVEVQPTPNPNAMKFVLDRPITAGESLSFFDASAAEGNDLAKRLFDISGVTTVLMLGDFVTVNKAPATKWATVTPKIKKVLLAG